MIKILTKSQQGIQISSKLECSKKLIGTRQLEVSDLIGILRKVNIWDVHKISPANIIVSCILDEQIFARKGKYINDPHILKKVLVIDTFLQDYFLDIGPRCQ